MSTYLSQMARMYKTMLVATLFFSGALYAADMQIDQVNQDGMKVNSVDNQSIKSSDVMLPSDAKSIDVHSTDIITPKPASDVMIDQKVTPSSSDMMINHKDMMINHKDMMDMKTPDMMAPKPSTEVVPQQTVDPSLSKTGVSVQEPIKVDLTQDYVNKDKGYSIVFPKNWEMKEKFMGLDVFALSPLEGDKDMFRENVNLITEDLTTPMSLDEYYSMGLVNLKTLLTDFKEIDSGKNVANGIDMKWIVYDHRMGEVKARVLQYIAVKDKRAYVITFSAMPDDFAKYKPSFEEIAKTFKFNGDSSASTMKSGDQVKTTEIKTTNVKTEVVPAHK